MNWKEPAPTPLNNTLALFKTADPMFVITTVCGALALPTLCAGKIKLAGLSCSFGTASGAPVPVRFAVRWLNPTAFNEFVVKERFSVTVSAAVGTNCTEITHPVPGNTTKEAEQLTHALAISCQKFEGMLSAEKSSGRLPMLKTVWFSAGLVSPTLTVPKFIPCKANVIFRTTLLPLSDTNRSPAESSATFLGP